MERIHLNPADLKDARRLGYNHGIIANGTFYMAGQVAMNAAGEIVGDDIETQARRAYDNVGSLLASIGKDFTDVVKVTTHLVDPEPNYDGYKHVYTETFREPYPCHTLLGSPRLAHPEYLVEIEIEVPLTDDDIAGIESDGDEIIRVT